MKKTILSSEQPEKRTIKSNRRKIVNTIPKLVDFIRRSLGEPLVRVEVTDEQIEDIIFETIQLYGEYAYQGREEVELLVNVDNNQKSFILDDRVKAILNLKSTNTFNNMYFLQIPNGYALGSIPFSMSLLSDLDQVDITSIATNLSRISNIQTLFDINVNYKFNENTKELRIIDNLNTNTILLELALEYEPKEEDMIYNHPWIKKMCIAKTKLLWGNITGKYSSSLVNGTSINYDRLISEAQTDIDNYIEELKESYREPLGIYVC